VTWSVDWSYRKFVGANQVANQVELMDRGVNHTDLLGFEDWVKPASFMLLGSFFDTKRFFGPIA
jgi:hypothetical protein